MNNQQNSNNSAAVVAIIVVGLLIAGAGLLHYKNNSEPKVIEKQTVIEREAPDQKPASADEEDPDFSLEYENEDGERTEIQAGDGDTSGQ